MSLAQLLISRRPRNKLLISLNDLLKALLYDIDKVRQQLEGEKENNKTGPDLPVLLPGNPVRVALLTGSKQGLTATLLSHHKIPRSYVVECRGRRYRRNRKYLPLSTYKAEEHSTPTPSFTMVYQNPLPLPSAPPNVSPVPMPERQTMTEAIEPHSQEQSVNKPVQPLTPGIPKPGTGTRVNTPKTSRSGLVVRAPVKLDL